MGGKCMDVEEFPSQVNILKSPTKRKEGLACNLYSHQVGAISIAEEGRKTARWAIKGSVDFSFPQVVRWLKIKGGRINDKSRPGKKKKKNKYKDDGNSKFIFGWDPDRRPGLLTNHFLDFGVDLLRCVTLNNGGKVLAEFLF